MLHRRARTEQHPQKPTTPSGGRTADSGGRVLPGALAVPAERLFLDYVHRHPPVISGNRPAAGYLTCSSTFAKAGGRPSHRPVMGPASPERQRRFAVKLTG